MNPAGVRGKGQKIVRRKNNRAGALQPIQGQNMEAPRTYAHALATVVPPKSQTQTRSSTRRSANANIPANHQNLVNETRTAPSVPSNTGNPVGPEVCEIHEHLAAGNRAAPGVPPNPGNPVGLGIPEIHEHPAAGNRAAPGSRLILEILLALEYLKYMNICYWKSCCSWGPA
ncbi:uncharacterized protein LOC123268116 [Cotesia glomerata]|uniref:uncharacterized protein LOC123268116 n=1 Tax=Cotesia glomerata TaxID=32391 RepID=UPI001D003807|nr:uncharacterized protein LOC123268116 [Cotesia glomerata]